MIFGFVLGFVDFKMNFPIIFHAQKLLMLSNEDKSQCDKNEPKIYWSGHMRTT